MLKVKLCLKQTLEADKSKPNRAYKVKVRKDITTGVVAQKYTHIASKYFLFFKNLTSV